MVHGYLTAALNIGKERCGCNEWQHVKSGGIDGAGGEGDVEIVRSRCSCTQVSPQVHELAEPPNFERRSALRHILQGPKEGDKQWRLSKHSQEALERVHVMLLEKQSQLLCVRFGCDGV